MFAFRANFPMPSDDLSLKINDTPIREFLKIISIDADLLPEKYRDTFPCRSNSAHAFLAFDSAAHDDDRRYGCDHRGRALGSTVSRTARTLRRATKLENAQCRLGTRYHQSQPQSPRNVAILNSGSSYQASIAIHFFPKDLGLAIRLSTSPGVKSGFQDRWDRFWFGEELADPVTVFRFLRLRFQSWCQRNLERSGLERDWRACRSFARP